MRKKPSIWVEVIRSGLIGGAASLLLCLVGMVVEFSVRYIISGVISMGQIFVIAPIIVFAYTVARRFEGNRVRTLFLGAVSGLSSGAVLAFFVFLGQFINFRAMLVNASPALYLLLTFGKSLAIGLPALL